MCSAGSRGISSVTAGAMERFPRTLSPRRCNLRAGHCWMPMVIWPRKRLRPREWLHVESEETAFFIRRFLRHPQFRTSAQRLGKVIRVQLRYLGFWTIGAERLVKLDW